MIQDLRIPVLPGGLIDQPHLWLIEYEIAKAEIEMMEMINQAAQTQPGVQD